MNPVRKTVVFFGVFIILGMGWTNGFAQFYLDIESGVVLSGYNDVRSPGTTGTRLSLSEELEADPTFFFRARLGFTFRERHTLMALYAPLLVESEGQVDRIVAFEGVDFPANTPLRSRFRFNSYRLTYRYDLYRSDRLQAGSPSRLSARSVRV